MKSHIFDITYTDKEIRVEINNLIGEPFGFVERIKLGGIGSHRMMIKSSTKELEKYIDPGHSVKNFNIELRSKGIIIHLKRRAQRYAWVIPYDQLTIHPNHSQIGDSENLLYFEGSSMNGEFFRKLSKLSKDF